MFRISKSQMIDAPSEPGFACLADVSRHTGWYGSAKECTGTYL
ncbi:MAG: hypothetical protein QGI76_10340 [Dehalococcoidia bacterium]|nr:hypothetical protein [Dehalococcoidia bacterium]